MTIVSEQKEMEKNRRDGDNIIIFSNSDDDIKGNENDPVGVTNGDFDTSLESQN